MGLSLPIHAVRVPDQSADSRVFFPALGSPTFPVCYRSS